MKTTGIDYFSKNRPFPKFALCGNEIHLLCVHQISNLAPISKKPGPGPIGKAGTGVLGKSVGKSGVSSTKPTGFGSTSSGKATVFGPSSSSKSYPTTSYNPSKSKPSATFSIIWIPTKKRNKKKDVVFNSHNYDHYPKGHERSPSMYKFMSGDSSEHQPHKKKEEETDLLSPERSKAPIAAVAGTALASSEGPVDSSDSSKPEENKGFIQYNKEESKDVSVETNERAFKNDKNDDYLENDKVATSEKQDKEKFGDNVDSVFLRPPPPHKARANTPTAEEEDCGIKCLYYTLQCCDCVLM